MQMNQQSEKNRPLTVQVGNHGLSQHPRQKNKQTNGELFVSFINGLGCKISQHIPQKKRVAKSLGKEYW